MAKSLDDARKELEHEFQQFREGLGRIHIALMDLDKADATSDVHGLLQTLEDVVKDVRTGGLMGSGAKGHRAAREDWLAAGGS